jgi:hypothetical protein
LFVFNFLTVGQLWFKLALNGWQLQEVGDFNQNAFVEKIFLYTKKIFVEQDAANFL